MAKFSDRLRDLRKSRDLSQQELSKMLRISKSSVNMYERGEREPGLDTLELIADFFNVDLDYLLGKSDCPSRYHLQLRQPSTAIPENLYPVSDVQRIPILGRISAGLPLYADQQVEGYTCTSLNHGAEYFALRVTGDSMTAARIYDGDTLIVRRQDTVENGQVAVVMVGQDEATVKRFYRSGSIVTLMPQSLNPSHRPQIYDTHTVDVRIIGLVVECKISI